MGKPNSSNRKVTSRKRLRGNISNLRGFQKTSNPTINQNIAEKTINSTIGLSNDIDWCSGGNLLHQSQENTGPGVEQQKYTKLFMEGRRIVDINYFIEQLKVLNQHSIMFGCSLNNLFVYKESLTGLLSTIHFHCEMCNCDFKLFTNLVKPTIMDVTTGVVAAGLGIGIGFSNTKELFATIDIPFMCSKTYIKYSEKVNNVWISTAEETMKEAAKKEADYARQISRVDEKGIPLISVVADGCWSKRSYRSNYNALSGAAAVVGQQFGQVLYLGVKNKYCAVCAKSKQEPKNHKCYKNYEGASSSMEAATLVEAFKTSEVMYGVKYNKLIADGDSATYKKIIESRPYHNITVEKIECRNHILRNYCTKLRTLSQDTRFPLRLRKLLSSNIMRLRTAVVSAIRFRKKQDFEQQQSINLLKQDIINSIAHVFGQHKNCEDYFCKRQNEHVDHFTEIQECTEFYARLQEHLKRVWINARSLITDVDSNVVEQFNSIVAKHIGGKRINFSQKGSYEARCAAAVVRFNTKKPLTAFYKKMCGTDAPKTLIEFEINQERKVQKHLQRLRQNTTKKHTSKRLSRKVDAHYGEHCQKPDLPEDIYAEEAENFLQSLIKTDEERDILEKETVDQADSGKWIEERRKLLTASIFYKVCTRRPNTLCKNLVKELLYQTKSLNIFSLKHGRDNEGRAKKQLEVQENVRIKPCGLFVDKQHCFLGATPDGLVDDDVIVEIKCPSSAFNMCPEDAVKQKKIKFWTYNPTTNDFLINMKNQWYYQIQGQLRITGRNGCLFAVWTGEQFPLKTAYIKKSVIFWEKMMEPQLTKFYKNCLLPELVDPRFTRNMEIREPSYILEARKKKGTNNTTTATI